MSTTTVGELIEFLQNFDARVQVLINSDGGTPDFGHLPNHMETVYFLGAPGSDQDLVTCTADLLPEMIAEGLEIKTMAPLLWPM
jgi:hypothetical protein